jgi:hypothetical protein
MSTQKITLNLSEALIEQAQCLGIKTQRDAIAVLTDALESVGLMLENLPESNLHTPIHHLSDEAVIALAETKMPLSQNQRLGELQGKGKVSPLIEAEQYELMALLQVYQLGQLRKSEALAEAVQRGLREPLHG